MQQGSDTSKEGEPLPESALQALAVPTSGPTEAPAHRDALQLRLVKQVVQFVLGGLYLLLVSSIHHVPAREGTTLSTGAQVSMAPCCAEVCATPKPLPMAAHCPHWKLGQHVQVVDNRILPAGCLFPRMAVELRAPHVSQGSGRSLQVSTW